MSAPYPRVARRARIVSSDRTSTSFGSSATSDVTVATAASLSSSVLPRSHASM